MTKPKVYILSLYNNLVSRGVESFSDGLVANLTSLGVDVTLVCGGKVTANRSYKILTLSSKFYYNFTNKLLSVLGIDGPGLSALIFSIKFLTTSVPETESVVVVMNRFWTVLAARVYRFITGKKIKKIACGHSGIGHDDYKMLKSGPDIFVALTQQSCDWATKLAPLSTSVILIPLGVDIAIFSQAVPKPLFDNSNPIIYCNAALVHYKRVDLVITAVSKLQKTNLILTGGGLLQKELTGLGNNLLGTDRFKCLGSINYTEIPAIYASCDVFTLASETVENSPTVYLEAMAAGKPVVTTDYDRARWLLDGAGVFVDPKDTASYSEALRRVLADPSFQKSLIQAGTERVKFFSWEKVALDYLKLLAPVPGVLERAEAAE